MNLFDRIFALHAELASARQPVSRQQLEERLECSTATVKRVIAHMRNYLNAPLEYDAELNGYFYATENEYGPRYELPGLWFNDRELSALLSLRELISNLQPGLLTDHLAPLDELLGNMSGVNQDEIGRVRILAIAGRDPGPMFGKVAEAVLSRKQLTITYHARSDDRQSQRTISPQRLTHYRDNWFVDAWCHQSEGLRTFAVERIGQAELEEAAAKDVSELDLNETLASGYGIFSGKATELAEIKVSPKRARWVADETWHPQQSGSFNDDGSYMLRLPYSRSEELIGDILRLGADAEVLSPASLREKVVQELALMASRYA